MSDISVVGQYNLYDPEWADKRKGEYNCQGLQFRKSHNGSDVACNLWIGINDVSYDII